MKKIVAFLLIALFMIFPAYAESDELHEFMGIPWNVSITEREQLLLDAGLEVDGLYIVSPMSMFGYNIEEASIRTGLVEIDFERIESSYDDKFIKFYEAVGMFQSIADGCIERFGEPDRIILERHYEIERRDVQTYNMIDLFTPENFFGVDIVSVRMIFNNVLLTLSLNFDDTTKANAELVYYDNQIDFEYEEIEFTADIPEPTPSVVDLY